MVKQYFEYKYRVYRNIKKNLNQLKACLHKKSKWLKIVLRSSNFLRWQQFTILSLQYFYTVELHANRIWSRNKLWWYTKTWIILPSIGLKSDHVQCLDKVCTNKYEYLGFPTFFWNCFAIVDKGYETPIYIFSQFN